MLRHEVCLALAFWAWQLAGFHFPCGNEPAQGDVVVLRLPGYGPKEIAEIDKVYRDIV